MLGKLILIFVLVPLVDLVLLMVLSSYTGWQFSVALVILSGIVGAYLAKRSYRSVWNRFTSQRTGAIAPADVLTDGAMIFFAAGLLLTPGFITDAAGFSLLIPACRKWYKSLLKKWFFKNVQFQVVNMKSGYDESVVDGKVVSPGEPVDNSDDPLTITEQDPNH